MPRVYIVKPLPTVKVLLFILKISVTQGKKSHYKVRSVVSRFEGSDMGNGDRNIKKNWSVLWGSNLRPSAISWYPIARTCMLTLKQLQFIR